MPNSIDVGKIDIYNESCLVTMSRMPQNSVDVVLTSPFYNTNKKAGKSRTLNSVKSTGYDYVRYDTHVDNMTDEEYCEYTRNIFMNFDRILAVNGCVLYNLSYGADNTEGMFKAVNSIITETPFTIADVIVWKKNSALPNNCSPNRLTRIWEFIFVFCRKSEASTFLCNKKIKSYRETGQASFENLFNFIEAKNNDGPCPYNKATFSSDLCEKLLNMYVTKPDATVYDPFIGSGTTAVACKRLGLNCIGSEVSEAQVEWAKNRIQQT